jgi:hypothetical protein
MTAAFLSIVLILLVIGVFCVGLERATMYWGCAMADPGHCEQDIEHAGGAADTGYLSERMRSFIQQRDLQDSIRPPFLPALAITYWVACLAAYIWGFFSLPLYLAVFWPIVYVTSRRVLQGWMPDSSSDCYRQKIIASLSSRRERFKRSGEITRVRSMEDLLIRLRIPHPALLRDLGTHDTVEQG